MIRVLLAVALFCVMSAAESRPVQHGPSTACIETSDIMRPCAYQPNPFAGVRSIRVRMHRQKRTAIQRTPQARETASSEVIGSRPDGCPHAYCGCGASLHLFGRIIPALNLAANWLRFPRAEPAPKMAAARVGHVMVLEQHISGDLWMVWDANSGHGKTRLHARSIAGFHIVDPSGSAR